MSIYQSTCERFICSPIASVLTAALSAFYFVSYPSITSLFVTTLTVKGVDLLQKALLQYDLDRFKRFPRTHEVDEDEQEDEQPEEEQEEEQEDEANDEREEDEEYIPSHKPTIRRRTYNLRNCSD